MSVQLEPSVDYVVAQPEKVEPKTKSGFYIPESAQEKPQVAVILAVGKNVADYKVGDRILYKSFSSNEFKLDGENYLIVKAEDILATVK
ncbi:MAG TPA: co-chaperone GroES [Candidatus Saccharimonadales bacterium]|nr:co-chaperone GroES [Candidatus Saccharimonadales bacterium]